MGKLVATGFCGAAAHNARKPPLPHPRRTDVAVGDMTWSLRLDISHKVTAKALPGAGAGAATAGSFGYGSLGWVLQEAERVGGIMIERVDGLRVKKNHALTDLKAGKPVTNMCAAFASTLQSMCLAV